MISHSLNKIYYKPYKKMYDKSTIILLKLKFCNVGIGNWLKYMYFSLSSVIAWTKLLTENIDRHTSSKISFRSSILIKYGNRRKQNG